MNTYATQRGTIDVIARKCTDVHVGHGPQTCTLYTIYPSHLRRGVVKIHVHDVLCMTMPREQRVTLH